MGCFCSEKGPLECGHWCLDGLVLVFITPSNLFVQLECFIGESRSKKFRRGYWLIWDWFGLF
jgi:hypothetical protein